MATGDRDRDGDDQDNYNDVRRHNDRSDDSDRVDRNDRVHRGKREQDNYYGRSDDDVRERDRDRGDYRECWR